MLLNIFKIIYKSVFVVLKKNLRSIRVKKKVSRIKQIFEYDINNNITTCFFV